MRRKMRNIVLISVVLLTLGSCKLWIDGLHRDEFGSISVEIGNAPVVEMVTKADVVSAENFNVYISSSEAAEDYEYVYKDMPVFITVPAGMYSVRAENVTEDASFSQPDQWGQIRYAGASETKSVTANNVTNFSFTCYVANTVVSVVFDSSIAQYFTDYSVSVYNEEYQDRQLVYTQTNTTSVPAAVGYFRPGTIHYLFSGTFVGEDTPRILAGTKDAAAATHQHLTFRVAEQNGSIGKPEIVVDTNVEDYYETITVDPMKSGN